MNIMGPKTGLDSVTHFRPQLRLNPRADDYLASPSPPGPPPHTAVLSLHDSSASKSRCCPPQGPCAHSLTLLLTTAAIFLAAWTILGPIAAPGGTVFALLRRMLVFIYN